MKQVLFMLVCVCLYGICSSKSMPTIWATELALGGVHHLDTRASVLERFGKPDSTENPNDVKNPSITYPGLTVTFNEGGNTVGFLRSTSPKYCTPSGLCPGMPFAKADAIYSSIHISGSRDDAKFTAYFGSHQDCRLTFEVEQGIIKTLGAGCMSY